MAYTQAGKRAVSKYMKNNYDTITFRVPKGKRDKIKAYAEHNNTSVNKLLYDYLKTIIPDLND